MTTLAADLTTMTPAEIDALLFAALEPAQRAEARASGYRRSIWKYKRAGEKHYASTIASYQEALDKIEASLPELYAPAQPYEAEFERRGGWPRYVVVPGGHLHYRTCHTITPMRTLIGLVAEASGLDQGEVVGKYGTTACTHCFPDAPVAKPLSLAEAGYCETSGTYPGWEGPRVGRYGMTRYLKCECGGRPSLTSTGKVRKHKPGTPS